VIIRGCLVIALVACGSARPSRSSPPRAPTLDDVAWLAGAWHADVLDSRWLRASDGKALWGIVLSNDGGFEVNVITDRPPITLLSIGGGSDVTRFPLVSAAPARLEFADAAGRRVVVTREGAGWRGSFQDLHGEPVAFVMQPGSLAAAPELEALDRAFSDDVAASGGSAWLPHFADDGAEWTDHRVAGADLDAMMRRVLAGAALTWAPRVSGQRGAFGFTEGDYTLTPRGSGAVEHGSYVTVWRKGGDGRWQIVFDIGDNAR
jgi:hypothetical protein